MLSKGITHYLGGPRPPAALLIAVAVLSLLGVAISLTVPGVLFADENGSEIWLPYLFAIVGVAAVSPILTNRQLLFGYAGLGLLVAGVASFQGAEPAQAITAGLTIGITSVSVILAFRISVRMLKVVWQIERSRTVESALAVAEERLRFSRDLHDVLGRNLSVMAVKSELATELIRRSRAEAATEIAEVNRIAQESLREVRAVVRGYRQADFATELAGARGILAAAGIDCRVDGDPTGLPAEIQKALGWAVRETTTNVLRHSQARTCTIAIAATSEVAVLTVANDGVAGGPAQTDDLAARPRDNLGSGLAGLRERLVALEGTLDAGPVAPDGFKVTASIPLQRSGKTPDDGVAGSAESSTSILTAEKR